VPETNLKTAKITARNKLSTRLIYAWTQEQATLLRSQQWSQIDLPNLIEEIESLGKQQRQNFATV